MIIPRRLYWANVDHHGRMRSAPIDGEGAGPWLHNTESQAMSWRFPKEHPVRVRLTIEDGEG